MRYRNTENSDVKSLEKRDGNQRKRSRKINKNSEVLNFLDKNGIRARQKHHEFLELSKYDINTRLYTDVIE